MYDLHAPAFINAMDAAPIPNFQAVVRPNRQAELIRYIRYHAEGLAIALERGQPSGVQHSADHLANLIAQARAGAA
jgi:hypothetical protein